MAIHTESMKELKIPLEMKNGKKNSCTKINNKQKNLDTKIENCLRRVFEKVPGVGF